MVIVNQVTTVFVVVSVRIEAAVRQSVPASYGSGCLKDPSGTDFVRWIYNKGPLMRK